MGRSNHNLKRQKGIRRILRSGATPAEKQFWKLIRKRQLGGHKFRRQYGVDRYVLDFFCPALGLAIEVDGRGHDEPRQRELDLERTRRLGKYGIEVLRFRNRTVLNQLDYVVEAILDAIARCATARTTAAPAASALGDTRSKQFSYHR